MSDQEHQAITRSELVESLAEQFPQLLPRDVELAVKTLLDTMTQALAEGKRIELRGVGSFVLHHRPARTGAPRTRRRGRPSRSGSARQDL